MSIKEGLKLVADAFTPFYHDPHFDLPAPIKTLEPDAKLRANSNGTVFMDRAASCSVGYKEGHHEILIWHIGLMFVEYVAGMLAKKAEDGHCRNHVKPCGLTRQTHLRMLGRFKDDLLAVVNEIESIEKESLNWPPSTSPSAGSSATGS